MFLHPCYLYSPFILSARVRVDGSNENFDYGMYIMNLMRSLKHVIDTHQRLTFQIEKLKS